MRTGTARNDGGFTLPELLVAMSLFAILGTLLLTTTIGAKTGVASTRSYTDITDQARAAVNRLARDLREAQTIDATYPTSGDGHTGITFEADFNNDGAIQVNGTDPEQLTYCYQGSQLLLFAGAVNCDSAAGGDVIADHISAFALSYTSSYNANNTGTETWAQLDAAGDNNGTLDAGEWSKLDGITIAVTIAQSGHQASFATTVNLRNR